MYKTSLIYIFWPWWIGYGQQQQCTYVCTFTKQGKCIYKHIWSRTFMKSRLSFRGFCTNGCGKVNIFWEGHYLVASKKFGEFFIFLWPLWTLKFCTHLGSEKDHTFYVLPLAWNFFSGLCSSIYCIFLINILN